MDSEEFLRKINKYAKWNSIVIFSLFLFVALFGITAIVGAIIKVTVCKDSDWYFWSILAMLVCSLLEIIVGNASIKLRRKYIESCDRKKLLKLIEFLVKNKNIRKYQFIELKYIFIKGLFFWVNNQEFNKLDSIQRKNKLENHILTKKEFLLISIFKCISIHDNDVNQKLYVSKFEEIIQKYRDILVDKKNDSSVYCEECFSIENQFQMMKDDAEKNQTVSYVERKTILEGWVEFCSNYKAVKITKYILLVGAVITVVFQEYIDSAPVTNYFNITTIILLAIEVGNNKD